MSGFLSNLIARHTGTENKVLPRLPGRFESYAAPLAGPDDHAGLQSMEEPAMQRGKEETARGAQEPSKTHVHATSAENTFVVHPQSKKPGDEVSPQPSNVNTTITDDVPVARQAAPVAPVVRIPDVHLHNTNITEPLIQKEIVHRHETLHPAQVINQVIMPPDTTENLQPLNNLQPPTSNFKQSAPENAQMPVDASWLRELRKTMSNSWPAEHAGSEQQPVIKVTIGRVDVRAVTQPQGSAKASSHPKPGMSLEDFLKNKNGTSA